ncbi:hypothetical protein PJI18_15640 [Mycobacterium kansasii]
MQSRDPVTDLAEHRRTTGQAVTAIGKSSSKAYLHAAKKNLGHNANGDSPPLSSPFFR